jgi:anti-sigma regulatory factor (Ser/Thr protein kinase)
MARVEVTFTPLSAHVRTARLVATAVARRSGVPDALLDEVRLAVGEACSRAVEAHQAACPAEPIRVALTDQAGRFEVEVVNNTRSPAKAQVEATNLRTKRSRS